MSSKPSSASQFVPVAVVIPAYNESGRIGKVLSALREVGDLSEIIVVDDGSIDDTYAEVLQAATLDPRLRCVRLPANGGKGGAMFAGARAAKAQILLFLDGDLLGLKPHHVRDLIQPVCTKTVDMTVGVFHGGKFFTDVAHWMTPWLSGQRCLSAEHFFQVNEHNARGYSVETAISLTARRHKWCRKYLALRGVWHPISENRRGFVHGLLVRSKMYADILRTLRAERVWQLLLSKSPLIRLTLMMALLLISISLVYNRSMAASRLHPEDLPALSLTNFQHILVIAPHPDDETLGAGGVIQTALANGSEVRVVIVTNGDGQALGPLAIRGKIWPHPVDYIFDGERRQAESTAALKELGLSPDAIAFLGYPDHQLSKLWLDDWKTQCPLRAKYTRDWRSPYPQTYDSQSMYCGRDLLFDLRNIIAAYKPDLVLLPHPNDENLDHMATSNFARMAIAQVIGTDLDYKPQVFGYLIHYGFYPRPRGLHTQKMMLPPIPLSGPGIQWEQVSLTPEQVQKKSSSIEAYTTQLLLLRSFLPSFARQNEIFVQLPMLDLHILGGNGTSTHESGQVKLPLFPQPEKESTRRVVVSSADLISMQVERDGGSLWLTAQTHGSLLNGLVYRLMVKYPDGQTQVVIWPGTAIRRGPNSYAFKMGSSHFNAPTVLGFAADVKEGATLDRSGWIFIILRNDSTP